MCQILFKHIFVFRVWLIHKKETGSFNQADKIGLNISQYFIYPWQVGGYDSATAGQAFQHYKGQTFVKRRQYKNVRMLHYIRQVRLR